MKKTILALVTLLCGSGAALAGSDHYGSDYVPGTDIYPITSRYSMESDATHAVYPSSTKSIGTAEAASSRSNFDSPAPAEGQGIWGH